MFTEITANWTFVDWAFALWMIFSILLGLLRGFIAEMLSLIGWIIAFVVAFQYGEFVGSLIPLPTKEPTVIFAVGFIIAFIAALVAWAIAKTIFRFAVGHGWIDHILGLIFGIARGILVSAVLVGLASILFPLPEQDWWKKSQSHEFLENSARELQALLPEKWGARMQLDIENIKQKVPSTLPEIADSLPSSVKKEIGERIIDSAIKQVVPKQNQPLQNEEVNPETPQ